MKHVDPKEMVVIEHRYPGAVEQSLIEARELISNPERWTTGYLAKTKSGSPRSPFDVPWDDEKPYSFCAQGALLYLADDFDENYSENYPAFDLLNEVADTITYKKSTPVYWSFITVNNEFGHQTTLKMFDEAIELAKLREL